MGQTTPYIPQLPEDTQKMIDLAYQKINVLREEEQKMTKYKVELEKETAREEVRRDNLLNEIKKLEGQEIADTNRLETLKTEINSAVIKLGETHFETQKKIKDAEISQKKANETIETATKSLIEVKAEQEKNIIEKETVTEMLKSFETKKQRIIELLKTI